jgi:phosphopantothenoylcysteine decarboxylase / phosphopantothenate---cysteine ligase
MNAILGVSGGIAAYKAAELARALMERGFTVQVIMTASAQEFIRPLTFAALTGKKVITGLFASNGAEDVLASSIEHIAVAQSNDVLVVAPATASLLACFANGIADDFLTTTYLAFAGPVITAPAMNTQMWNHPATRENIRILSGRGHVIIEPGEGLLACGTTGSGRLPDPAHIAEIVQHTMRLRRDLEGETVLVTAGPTREPLDPVRYISNRSSGKMGYALAANAAARGARVILISGPVQLDPPAGVELVRVTTAVEMREGVMKRLAEASIVVAAAAVADYHLADVPKQKVKKTGARLNVELEPTPDILAGIPRDPSARLVIGFAAETENLMEEATRKLTNKNCDMVVANLVSQPGIGFESDENEVTLVKRGGQSVKLNKAPKSEIAAQIFDEILKLRLAQHAAQ